MDRLSKAIADSDPRRSEGAEELVQLIFNSMDDFSKGCQTDDATLAVLRVA